MVLTALGEENTVVVPARKLAAHSEVVPTQLVALSTRLSVHPATVRLIAAEPHARRWLAPIGLEWVTVLGVISTKGGPLPASVLGKTFVQAILPLPDRSLLHRGPLLDLQRNAAVDHLARNRV